MATVSGNRPAAAGLSDNSSTHQYTCNTCQVAFRLADTQKGHMKSDWHRYNLKRRVASLPPISSEVFTEKVLQARAATSAEADRAGFQQVCEVCERTYFSENSYKNHLSSQKHKAKVAAMQRKGPSITTDETRSVISSTFSLGDPLPTGSEEVSSEAEDEFSEVVENLKNTNLKEVTSPVARPHYPHPSAEGQHQREHPISPPTSQSVSSSTTPVPVLSLKSCLFCNYKSPTVPLNVVHMERIHGMFIPEKQYLVDLDGLIRALQQRIQEFNECLFCGKVKTTGFAAQTHMRDKGHCKIPFDTEEEQLEIGEFYDFRSTYSDDDDDDEDESEDGDKQSGGAKLGARRAAKAIGEDGAEIMADEEGWETDSSASSVDSDELTSIPIDQHQHQYDRLDKHPHHSSHDPRHHHQKDGWHSHAHKHRAVFYDDTQLYLPSGRSVGHRSMAKYYRQNLHSYPTAEERAERHALQGAERSSSADSMDVGRGFDGRRGRRPASTVVPRNEAGLVGVSTEMRKEITRVEKRAKWAAQKEENRHLWRTQKAANHQKHFNYQLL